jgi:ATP-dependent Clp protease ATP-binding subunit ClpC
LQRDIEDKVSEMLLSKELQSGAKLTIGASKGKITFNVHQDDVETRATVKS